jgi:tetratricopeptide (TPR) repeat protein
VEEVEKARVGFIEDIVAEGKTLVEKATEIGADVTEVRGQLDEVTAALEKKDFATANEKAKKAVETAKTLPKAFVQGIISEARTKVLAVDKLGADAMMAKNFLIKARSSLAAGDFTAALKACDKCMEELEKAPKALVNKRIALARTDMDYVRSTGQDTTALEQELSGAEAKVAEADFEGAIGIVQDITDRLKALKGLGQEVTNILFDADMSVAEAAEAGRDVKKAKGIVEEAFKLRATDPTKAKELALEAKKLLEQ